MGAGTRGHAPLLTKNMSPGTTTQMVVAATSGQYAIIHGWDIHIKTGTAIWTFQDSDGASDHTTIIQWSNGAALEHWHHEFCDRGYFRSSADFGVRFAVGAAETYDGYVFYSVHSTGA